MIKCIKAWRLVIMDWEEKTLNKMLHHRNVNAETYFSILDNVQTDTKKHELINWLLEMREVTQEQILEKAEEIGKE